MVTTYEISCYCSVIKIKFMFKFFHKSDLIIVEYFTKATIKCSSQFTDNSLRHTIIQWCEGLYDIIAYSLSLCVYPVVSPARDCGHSQGPVCQGSCDLTEELHTGGNTHIST